MTLIFEILNNNTYIQLDGITSIKFSLKAEYDSDEIINPSGWLRVLNFSGSRCLLVKINGILNSFSADKIIREHSFLSSINKYKLKIDPGEEVDFDGIISSYERIYVPDDFDSFSFTLISTNNVVFSSSN